VSSASFCRLAKRAYLGLTVTAIFPGARVLHVDKNAVIMLELLNCGEESWRRSNTPAGDHFAKIYVVKIVGSGSDASLAWLCAMREMMSSGGVDASGV
jgi:hypothetical protein